MIVSKAYGLDKGSMLLPYHGGNGGQTSAIRRCTPVSGFEIETDSIVLHTRMLWSRMLQNHDEKKGSQRACNFPLVIVEEKAPLLLVIYDAAKQTHLRTQEASIIIWKTA